MATQKDNTNLYIIGGLAVLAYTGVLNPLLKAFGVKDSDNVVEDKKDFENALKDEINKAKNNINTKQQASDIQIKAWADNIHNALRFSSLDDNYEKAGLYLSMPKTQGDVLRLIQLFGKRQECYFGVICYNYFLPEMVVSNLSQQKIFAINDNYKRKGITYRW